MSSQPPSVFSSNTTPRNLRQAITMFIDYLIELNESRVKVSEFNSAPLLEPVGIEYQEYYHEVQVFKIISFI